MNKELIRKLLGALRFLKIILEKFISYVHNVQQRQKRVHFQTFNKSDVMQL